MQVLCIRTVTAMHHLEEQQMEEREQFRALTSACAVRMSPMLSWFGRCVQVNSRLSHQTRGGAVLTSCVSSTL